MTFAASPVPVIFDIASKEFSVPQGYGVHNTHDIHTFTHIYIYSTSISISYSYIHVATFGDIY